MPRIDRRIRRRQESTSGLWPAPSTFHALFDAISRATDDELRAAITLAAETPRPTKLWKLRLEALEDRAEMELDRRQARDEAYQSLERAAPSGGAQPLRPGGK